MEEHSFRQRWETCRESCKISCMSFSFSPSYTVQLFDLQTLYECCGQKCDHACARVRTNPGSGYGSCSRCRSSKWSSICVIVSRRTPQRGRQQSWKIIARVSSWRMSHNIGYHLVFLLVSHALSFVSL